MNTTSNARLSQAELIWDAQGTPRARLFDDVYFSQQGGLEESQAVFLQGNDLPQRWQHAALNRPFVIAETGFGTGLNFLLTAQTFLQQAPASLRLHYLSLEAYPLKPQDLARALKLWPVFQGLSNVLQAQYPPPVPGCHRLMFAQGRVVLDVWWGESNTVLEQWMDDPDGVVDAWYLDGFAPRKNPQMWQPSLYQHMARLSRQQACFSTFTAAGQVRRDLQAAGFTVYKRPGFGQKREHLSGYLSTPVAASRLRTPPWFRRPLHPQTPARALIIGAGLAGTAAAYSLARRGWHCTLIDQATQLAAGASGNRQGIIYPSLTHHWRDLSSQFYLQAWLYAQRHQQALLAAGHAFTHDACGVLLSGHTQALHKCWQHQPLDTLAEWLNETQTGALTAGTLQQAALFFPQAGWLSPPQLCQAQWQAAGDGHTLLLNQPVTQIQRVNGLWHLYQAQEKIAEGELLILANADGAQSLLANVPLALHNVRGQVTHLSATPDSQDLRTVICGEGYLTPAWQGVHCLGATYDREHLEPQVRSSDNVLNFQQLQRAFPGVANILSAHQDHLAQAPARSSVRCASRDHLPMLGGLPNYTAFMQHYQDLHLGKRATEYPARPPFEGLYVTLGHGSRGLVSTALGAEMLAAQIHSEPLPCSQSIFMAIAAQRFWVRGLKQR